MGKLQNKTIGTIMNKCHNTIDAVRRDKNGKLYHVGRFGQHPMRTPEAQEYMLEHSDIWGAAGPPDDTPQWIVDNDPRPPVNGTAPVKPEPVADEDSDHRPVVDRHRIEEEKPSTGAPQPVGDIPAEIIVDDEKETGGFSGLFGGSE